MSSENKIEYYFLRASTEKFAAYLRHFAQDVHSFSDEQLLGIVSYCDHIRDNIEREKGVGKKSRRKYLKSPSQIQLPKKFSLKKFGSEALESFLF